jgi:hypothetical protein
MTAAYLAMMSVAWTVDHLGKNLVVSRDNMMASTLVARMAVSSAESWVDTKAEQTGESWDLLSAEKMAGY